MRYLSFDPGGVHTGWAFFDAGVLTDYDVINCKNVAEHSEILWVLLNKFQPQTVICESFLLRLSAASALIGNSFPTVERIGIIRLWCTLKKIPFIIQSPATAKENVPNFVLKRNGLWVRNRHAADAVRHGVYYWRKKTRTWPTLVKD